MSCLLFRCEGYYFSVDNGTDLPLFSSYTAGTEVDSTWRVTAYAPNWSAVSGFEIEVSVKEVEATDDTSEGVDSEQAGDTSATADTATSAPSTRITLEGEDGSIASLDHASSELYESVLLDLTPCTLAEGTCTQVVQLRIESLSDIPVSVLPSIYAFLEVPEGFCGPKDPDIQGLSISLEQITE